MTAAKEAGVKRVVLTSSIVAIGMNHAADSGKGSAENPFRPDDWSVVPVCARRCRAHLIAPLNCRRALHHPSSPRDADARRRASMSYMQSKTFAEKAARDVAGSLGVEIVTVHPSFVQATWLLFPHPRRRTYSACHGAGPDAAASRAGFGRRAQAAARRHGPRCTAWQRELVRRARRGRCSRAGAPCTGRVACALTGALFIANSRRYQRRHSHTPTPSAAVTLSTRGQCRSPRWRTRCARDFPSGACPSGARR